MKAGTALVLLTVIVLAFATYRLMSEESDSSQPAAEVEPAAEIESAESSPAEDGLFSEVIAEGNAIIEQRRGRNEVVRNISEEAEEELQRIRSELRTYLMSLERGVETAGVDRERLDSYSGVATTPDRKHAWNQFVGCAGEFQSTFQSYKNVVSAMNGRRETSVLVDGERKRIGVMTCFELLESSIDYLQRGDCEKARADMDDRLENLADRRERCVPLAQRIGLSPSQVAEILQLP